MILAARDVLARGIGFQPISAGKGPREPLIQDWQDACPTGTLADFAERIDCDGTVSREDAACGVSW
jgi:hypothetical protein